MPAALIVKLRPAGPWRSGPDSGARHRIDPVYHSDSLFAAVTAALATLGRREEWLDATARNPGGPAVQFSSCFPFQGETLFVMPPRSLWPPATPVVAYKVRWRSARFIPVSLVSALLAGQPLQEDQWSIDGPSECLLAAGQTGPFRINVRWSAAVDRLNGNAERHSTACIEFRRDAGLWAIAAFSNDAALARWSEPVRAAFRLLADSGFGGERSRGWGRSHQPEFTETTLPEFLISQPEAPSSSHWLLSLFAPSAQDPVDWQSGNYTMLTRGGRIESPAGFGERKKQLQMVAEGSVLTAGGPIRGAAPDVAPDGFAHPVFRSGFALSIALPQPVREEPPAPQPVPEEAA